jgi:hypothetical protein
MRAYRSILAAAPVMILGMGPQPASAGPLEEIFYPADANGIVPTERVIDEARFSYPGTRRWNSSKNTAGQFTRSK